MENRIHTTDQKRVQKTAQKTVKKLSKTVKKSIKKSLQIFDPVKCTSNINFAFNTILNNISANFCNFQF